MKKLTKKKIIYILTFLILLFLGYGLLNMKIPISMPTLKVKVGAKKFTPKLNGYNWSTIKESGSSSDLGYYAIEVAKKIEAYEVPKNSELNLVWSDTKGMENFYVKQVFGENKANATYKNITLTNNSIKVPDIQGEYIYCVFGDWDETHFVEYIIKVKVTD